MVSGSTLLNKHLTVEKIQVGGKEKKFLKLFLENLKEDTSKKGAHIKLFELGNFFCPVRAYFKGKQISRLDHYKEMPMFRHEDSKPPECPPEGEGLPRGSSWPPRLLGWEA